MTTTPTTYDEFIAKHVTDDMDEIDALLATIEAGKEYFETPAGKAEAAARQAEWAAFRAERRAREAAERKPRKCECLSCTGAL